MLESKSFFCERKTNNELSDEHLAPFRNSGCDSQCGGQPRLRRRELTKRDGWYFDLLYGFQGEERFLMQGKPKGEGSPEFIASVFTNPFGNRVEYVGARMPELGFFFVVDTGGPPRLMVGPVARGFVIDAPSGRRYDDPDVESDVARTKFKVSPWSKSYRTPESGFVELEDDGQNVTATTTGPGNVEFRALEEHGALLWKTTSVARRVREPAESIEPGFGERPPCGEFNAEAPLPPEILLRSTTGWSPSKSQDNGDARRSSRSFLMPGMAASSGRVGLSSVQ